MRYAVSRPDRPDTTPTITQNILKNQGESHVILSPRVSTVNSREGLRASFPASLPPHMIPSMVQLVGPESRLHEHARPCHHPVS